MEIGHPRALELAPSAPRITAPGQTVLCFAFFAFSVLDLMLFQCSVYFRQDALQIGPEKPLRCPKRPPTLPKVPPDAPKSPKRPPSSAQDVSTRLQATPTRPPKSPKRSPGASTEPPRGSCGAPRRPLHLQGDIDKEPVGGNGRKAFSIQIRNRSAASAASC